MWFWRAAFLVALVVIPAIPGVSTGEEITHPYEVLSKHFEASGGLERLKAERATYREGTLSVGGMQGTVKEWIQKPDRHRVEVDLGPIRIVQGDNGEISWQVDSNGKLQKTTKKDEATRKRAEVDRLIAEYEYADRNSDVFTVSLEGTEKVEGTDCYVVVVSNSINVDRLTHFIRVEDFRLEKSVAIRDQESADTYYGDYREVGGIWVAFRLKEVPHLTGQPQEVTWSHYESNPGLDAAALFDPPEEGGKDYEFTSGGAAQDIPFRFIGSHLYIPVTVNDKERLWILDTGAGMTVVDQAFADEMGMELEGDIKGSGAGGTVKASFSTLPPFSLEGIRFQEQTVAVIDMGDLIRRLGVDIAGILGYDFLSRFVTRVDFANERVSFYDPNSFEYTGDGRDLDVHISESLMESSATLDGDHEGTWLLDLGAGTTHLDGIYARREGYAGEDGVQGMGHGAGNEYLLKSVKCDSLRFAGFTVYEPIVSFHYGGTDTVFTSDRIGVLGNSLFRNFVLYLDYGNERLIVEKGEKFNQPWPIDRSGLTVGWNAAKDGIEVAYVSPGTPAEKVGFEKGDLLRSVNDVAVESLDGVIGVREMLKEAAGTRYEVILERDGQEKQISLELAELY
jgi:hypothetical protein